MSDNLTYGKLNKTDFLVSNAGAVHQFKPWEQAWKYGILGLRIPETKARAIQALTDVELGHRLQAFPAKLLGGEIQRAALAHSLVDELEHEHEPLLLADQLMVWPMERLPNRLASNYHLPQTPAKRVYRQFVRVELPRHLR
jgi:ABC-type sugar transport system ATPase subunit